MESAQAHEAMARRAVTGLRRTVSLCLQTAAETRFMLVLSSWLVPGHFYCSGWRLALRNWT